MSFVVKIETGYDGSASSQSVGWPWMTRTSCFGGVNAATKQPSLELSVCTRSASFASPTASLAMPHWQRKRLSKHSRRSGSKPDNGVARPVQELGSTRALRGARFPPLVAAAVAALGIHARDHADDRPGPEEKRSTRKPDTSPPTESRRLGSFLRTGANPPLLRAAQPGGNRRNPRHYRDALKMRLARAAGNCRLLQDCDELF